MTVIPVIDLLLLLAAGIFFALAVFNVPSRVNLLALAWACWVTVLIIAAAQHLY
jgi:hypothetical protein